MDEKRKIIGEISAACFKKKLNPANGADEFNILLNAGHKF